MGMIAKVGGAIQRLFGEVAELAGKATGVIQRQRKFDSLTLLRTFVLGFLKTPKASDEDLAQMAAQCGVCVTPQAIEQRHSSRLVAFLNERFEQAAKMSIESNHVLAPILERFSSVPIFDGSTVSLPDSVQNEFAGCGGSYDSGKAAMKLQTVFDLRKGTVTVELEQGKSPDGATPRQHERQGKGSLSIKDLGYFNLDVFEEQDSAEEYFLSRLQFGTDVMLEKDGESVDLLPWLSEQLSMQPGPFIDQRIYLGKAKRLACRLVAWRLPEEQANERRRKLREATLKKKGREPSEERLKWCDWTILVTNTPIELMSAQESAVMYGARWQVELLFKRWKSLNLVATLTGSTDVRQMVRVWSRLIMSLVQHWVVLASVWGDPKKSLNKACQAIRDFAGRIAAALRTGSQLEQVLRDLCEVVGSTCRRDKRSRAGTFEILNDPTLLDFC